MFVEDEVSAWIEALPVREYKVDADQIPTERRMK
jgi:hypothetical protein